MRYVEAGGAKVSVIGLGTWQFGSREWGYGADYATGEAVAITQRALDLGINLIDSAEAYAFGRSERIVGRAVASRRDEAFLATKILPLFPTAAVVQQRAKASARRLGVDHIDLYQLHWANPVVPLSWTMRGMRELQQRGVIRHVGVSNFSLQQWQSAEAALGGAVLSNQVSCSLVALGPTRDLIPWAQAHDRLVIAYSPLAQGFLSGRYDASNRPGGVRAANPLFLPENLERAAELLQALRDVAAAHDATAAQVALAWLIAKPNVVVIPGASSVAQLEANAAAADLDLTEEEVARLQSVADGFSPLTGRASYPDLIKARLRR